MQPPQPTPELDGSLEPTRGGGDPSDSGNRPRPLAEAIQLARWESEGGALRESELRTSWTPAAADASTGGGAAVSGRRRP